MPTRWFLPALGILAWCVLTLLNTAQAASLTIGTISNTPVKEIRQYTPIAQHLAARLGYPRPDEGRVIVARDIRHMAEMIKLGEVDIYIDSPLSSLGVNRLSGAEMVLRRWKHDIPEYESLIFVRNESKIESLSDLEGEIIGFKDPNSTSGYLLPRIALTESGLDLVPASRLKAQTKPGQIGYQFTNANENTIVWVLFGKIAAGAIAWDELLSRPSSEQERLRVIHQTPALPRHVVNFRPGLTSETREALIDALIDLERSPAGKELLKAFENTTRFDLLPPETLLQLEQIRPAVLAILGIP
ncbi:MAG: phosphate/phosphite/phosphonate ABC transporter substrate-binding protein [Magnetococcales bacterium]|nr:phosphate/phosphite/phosphonate ABC transporter substrate-binding protein [Magnetococcales bacterium]